MSSFKINVLKSKFAKQILVSAQIRLPERAAVASVHGGCRRSLLALSYAGDVRR